MSSDDTDRPASAGSDASATAPSRSELEAFRTALKATILDMERLSEAVERSLRFANERWERLTELSEDKSL